MLESGLPGRTRRTIGRALVATLVVTASMGAWAMQAPREIAVVESQPAAADGVSLSAEGNDHVNVLAINRQGDRLLRELAAATGRELQIEGDVAAWSPVTLTFQSVPAQTVVQIVEENTPGVRITMDDSTIRVSPAAG